MKISARSVHNTGTIQRVKAFLAMGVRRGICGSRRDLNLYKVGFDPVREVTNGEPITVTAGSTPLADPDFSPDGQWIVFNSHTTPQNLFLVRSDGTGLRQLTYGGQMDRCPQWSPDGSQIAFCSVRRQAPNLDDQTGWQ
jgi:hypothetical protein